MKQEKSHIDWYILLSISTLMLFSLAFVYSASASYAESQFGSHDKLFLGHIFRVLLGFFLIIFFAKIDYHIVAKFSKFFLIISILLLIFVLIVGTAEKGASRWIDLGPLRFQPSELAKLSMVLYIPSLIQRKGKYIRDFKLGVLPIMIWTGIVSLLIILQPSLSMTLVILFLSLILMFAGNVRLFHVFTISAIGLVGATILVLLKSDYRLNRVIAFFDNSIDATNLESYSYQLKQSLIAFGNGGLLGLGPGGSRQSNLFLPESYGDFIFSVIGEEYGFLGTSIIILIFLFFFWRGMKVAKNAPDNLGYLISLGITFMIIISVIINAGVNTGLLPTTGMPMPFISYGGTAILIYSSAIGILLNISSQAGVFKENESIIS